MLQLRLHEMSARLALHFLPHKPHGPAFHFGAGAPVVFPRCGGCRCCFCSLLSADSCSWTQTTDGAEDGRAGACPGRDSSVLGGSKNQQPLSCDYWHWSWLRNQNFSSKAMASGQCPFFFVFFVLLNLQWNGPGQSAERRTHSCKAELNHLLPFLLPKPTFLSVFQCESSSLKQGTHNN